MQLNGVYVRLRGIWVLIVEFFGAPKDQVQGYNIVEIENALIGPTTWNEQKTNIINNYNNGTEQYVETLFNHWNNY